MASLPLYSHRREAWAELAHSPIGRQAHDRSLNPADVHPVRRALIFRGCAWLAPAVIQALRQRGYRYYGSYAAPRGHGLPVGTPIHVLSRDGVIWIECSTVRIAAILAHAACNKGDQES